jgi:phosphate transport system protein
MNQQLQIEIEKLKKKILALGAGAEESVHRAVTAMVRRDAAMARQVIDEDGAIDQAEVDLEEECLKILALHQPVAVDLRFIVAVLRINAELERIGDLAVNIAERTVYLAGRDTVDIPFDFTGMALKAQSMLKMSLDSLVTLNIGLAREVLVKDDGVDAMNREMYLQVQDGIRRRPDQLDQLIHILSASRHLERIADHCTNIAEDVIYLAEGEIVRHKAEDYRTTGQGAP